MTPSARYSAAIGLLDLILSGTAAEKALTNWARNNRYAGSGDRHAIRDTVFDALRCKRSWAALGGSETGRGLVLGGLRAQGIDPETIFTGTGYAPAPLSDHEREVPEVPTGLAALDCPDWLADALQESLGDRMEPVMQALQHRAPLFLRVNLLKCDLKIASQGLELEGVSTRSHPLAATALEVVSHPRKVQASAAYRDGLVEVQDVASQAVVAALPLKSGMHVLDYCAGGGGKALAMAAITHAPVDAHDADPRRMSDLPARAARAGAEIRQQQAPQAPYDLVLTDVPCSGSGSWRRSPEGKWALTPQRLQELTLIQAEIMDKASLLVGPGGWLAYATCSMLNAENSEQIAAFLRRNAGWTVENTATFTPLDGGDGFFVSILRRV